MLKCQSHYVDDCDLLFMTFLCARISVSIVDKVNQDIIMYAVNLVVVKMVTQNICEIKLIELLNWF